MGEINYAPLIDDMTWSYSRLTCFEDCPYQWYMHYIADLPDEDKFYSSYGSFMHRLIERYYRGEATKDEMLMDYLVGFHDNVTGTRPSQKIVQKYIQRGIDYIKSFEPFEYNMIAVEKKVDFEVGGYPFRGIIDYLGEKDGDLYIVDNKSRDLKPRSERKKPTVKDKELDSMLKQLYLYSAAVKQEYGKFPVALCFNCFKAGVFIEEPFKESAYKDAIEWAVNKIEEIKATTDFPPNREFYYCVYLCGLSDYCLYDQLAREEKRREKS